MKQPRQSSLYLLELASNLSVAEGTQQGVRTFGWNKLSIASSSIQVQVALSECLNYVTLIQFSP